MSSSTPILTYFDIRGLAEVPRLMLAAAGAVYTDARIPFEVKPDGSMDICPSWAAEKKATTPYGQVPVLEVDGQKIAQSGAIIRYIAKKYHLDGGNEVECALIDAGFEALGDVRKKYYAEKDNAEKKDAYWSAGLLESFQSLEKNVVGSASAPWFRGGRMTYVDIAIYYTLFHMTDANAEATNKALASLPKLAAIFAAVPKDEKIAAYLAKRKVTVW